jgi:hypothetical protein
VETRKRLLTGNESFDKYFGIKSGTATIMYVQNQTFSDPMSILTDWLTNDVQATETLLLVTTYADPVSISRWCERRAPKVYEVFAKASQQSRFWWIDLFTFRGFSEQERATVSIGYKDRIRQSGGNPDILISPRKPDDLQSVEGLPAALNEAITPIQGKGTARMLMAYVDDFVDGVGAQAALNYLRRLISMMRKFGYTLVLVLGWRGVTPEFHTACERMADQVLRWGYGDVPGIRQPGKFLQIMKTTAPDEVVTYAKVPYTIRDGKPTVGLATQLDTQTRLEGPAYAKRSRERSDRPHLP